MSDEPRAPRFLDALREPAVRNYLFVGFAALLVYYVLASEYDRCGAMGALLTLVIAVPGLIARWVISPALFLILLTYLLLDPDFRGIMEIVEGMRSSWGRGYRRRVGLDDALLAASVLVYLMAQFRILSFVHKSMPEDPPPRRKGQPEPGVPRRPFRSYVDRELGILLGLGGLSVALGAFGWFFVVEVEGYFGLGRSWGIERPFARLMLFLGTLVAGAAGARAVFEFNGLRRMSRTQARLLLQDGFWQETRRELERIYRWWNWFKKRKPKGAE